MIELYDSGKTYPNGCKALEKINLSIQEGEFVSVIGASGAGKTTLIRLINGLEKISEGKVIVDGLEISESNVKKIRRRVGMVFQHFNIVEQLSVMTNVLSGCLGRLRCLPSLFYFFPKTDIQVAAMAIKRVGLIDKTWIRVDKLSGGQRQRVGVARALAQKPRIILADEPVASLDPVAGLQIMKILKEISVKDGITVVANLHQLSLARQFSDRVIGLYQGKIVFNEKPDQLTENIISGIYNGKTQNHTYKRANNTKRLAVANL
ncbi:MAG: phosphonate ABC transporter ATP-binding protein [Deltaproteobacteria bacterium]|nr:phosphonate ABC transporter ATP-binding protein [Deltaproteobacteria bacterium]